MRAILTYHSIDASGSAISVDPETFAGHVAWLGSARVRVVGLDTLLAAGDAEDLVALSFDDGFENFDTRAAPALLERGFPVTLFVVSDHTGRTNDWGGRSPPRIPTLPLLDWNALGRLVEQGVTLGSHTRTHPSLTQVPPEALEEELAGSAERIARETGVRPRWLAYPYGEVDQAVTAAAATHYQLAVTTEHRVLGPADDRMRLPRLDMYYYRHPRALERWNSSGFRRRIWLRRQARRARAALEQVGGRR